MTTPPGKMRANIPGVLRPELGLKGQELGIQGAGLNGEQKPRGVKKSSIWSQIVGTGEARGKRGPRGGQGSGYEGLICHAKEFGLVPWALVIFWALLRRAVL